MDFLHIIGFILFAIFITLGTIHVYWAFGGTWGASTAVPAKENGEALFTPSPLATIIVALALFTSAFIVLGRIEQLVKLQWPFIFYWGTWGITVVFFLRAVGDFDHIGFFKKHKASRFALLDTRFYSPLCLMISLGTFLISVFK